MESFKLEGPLIFPASFRIFQFKRKLSNTKLSNIMLAKLAVTNRQFKVVPKMNLNKREHNPKSRIFCQTFRHNKNLNAWYKLTMEPYLFFWCAIFFFCNNKFSVFQILVFFLQITCRIPINKENSTSSHIRRQYRNMSMLNR